MRQDLDESFLKLKRDVTAFLRDRRYIRRRVTAQVELMFRDLFLRAYEIAGNVTIIDE